ncbi:MAG: hypothetical protein AAFU79_09850 [Myxococcota bacterium]
MKEFTHAVVRTIGEDGTSRTVLLDMETAEQLTQAEITQVVSASPDGKAIPEDIQQVLSWDLGGMKRAIVEGEKKGLIDESSSMDEIQAYLDDYQKKHKVDFGIPRLT